MEHVREMDFSVVPILVNKIWKKLGKLLWTYRVLWEFLVILFRSYNMIHKLFKTGPVHTKNLLKCKDIKKVLFVYFPKLKGLNCYFSNTKGLNL